ncbi:hypothetical protein [Gluconobacter japonicus]|uniref:hypothetical protein n=1 Tax=Gluconobacter japonicus TaxID=376620 RepID=UPI001B8B1D4E|nr:hypothetical protein [Gluconobacter japonicus]MBS1050463.1 hypothetical protein [Gluconobacter japonicus]
MSSTLLNIETALNYVSGAGKNTTVKLGSVTLTGPEVPDGLRAGGEQVLVIHRLPGGDKVIDNGGNDPYRLSLTGRFQGTNALTRAQSIDTMRLAAKAVTFAAAGSSWQVLIRSYAYTYAQKGAVIQYELELEVIPSSTSATATGTSALSSLVGSGVTGALSTVTSTIADVSSVASTITSTAQNVIGQITPIANMIGVGGPLAKAQDALTSVSGMATTGENLANLPAALSGTITGLQSTVGQLGSVVSQAGENLESIGTGNAASLLALAANAHLELGALEASQSASVALKNAQAVSGQ